MFDVPSCSGHTSRMERTLAEVGQIVTKRRSELGHDAAELARIADVDPKTLASLEKGERWPRDKSRSRLEAALQWAAGSLTEIRKGGTASARVQPGPARLAIEGHAPQVTVAPVQSLIAVPLLVEAVTKVTAFLEAVDDLGDLVPYEMHVTRLELRSVLTGVLTSLLAGADRDLEPAAVDQITALIRRLFKEVDGAAGGQDESDAPPKLALAEAARTAPPGYIPGRSEQGDAPDEEGQDR